MIKKLVVYRGILSPAQVTVGMNVASNNAKRLLEDAIILFSAGRFPTATSLAILAIEEAGKLSVLRELALARSHSEAEETWRDYRSHTRKNVKWILPQLVADGARRIDDLRQIFNENSEHPFILDHLKQLGFYTDCLGKAHWSIPSDVIDEKLAQMIIETAKLLTRDSEHTEKEIELWCEHVGPVWKSNYAWMKQAVVNWYSAMQKAGLVPEGLNEMEKFMHEGLKEKKD